MEHCVLVLLELMLLSSAQFQPWLGHPGHSQHSYRPQLMAQCQAKFLWQALLIKLSGSMHVRTLRNLTESAPTACMCQLGTHVGWQLFGLDGDVRS